MKEHLAFCRDSTRFVLKIEFLLTLLSNLKGEGL